MSNKFTPGPWTVGEHQLVTSRGWSIRIADDSAIAYVLGEFNPELQGNARVISKAPEMLKLLQEIYVYWVCCEPQNAKQYLGKRLAALLKDIDMVPDNERDLV